MANDNFQFFKPRITTNPARLLPFGGADIDFKNPDKNINRFAQLAVKDALGEVKGVILKNTFQFFQKVSSGRSDAELDVIGTSVLGTPIYSNLAIRAGDYQDNDGVTIGKYDAINIEVAIFVIDQEDNLVLTDIQGRPNTVIEYTGSKSWMINCKGRVFSSDRNTYPYTAAKNLITALSSNKPLTVDSWFLNMAGIYQMTIKKKSIPQEEGSLEYQKFEFDAIADSPIVLKIQE